MLEWVVNALFGKKPMPQNAHEEPTKERTYEEYFQRYLRIKSEVINDDGILENIRNAFEHQYLGEEKREEILHLGQGDTHILFYVGEVVDPENQRPTHIAVRLWHYHDEPYDLDLRSRLFIPQIHQFERAFVNGHNPPYFVGAVCWKSKEFPEGVVAFLVEDVSEKRKYELTPDGNRFFFREEGKGRRTRFLLDPPVVYDADATSQYISESVRLDV